jgi:hypothetical protein
MIFRFREDRMSLLKTMGLRATLAGAVAALLISACGGGSAPAPVAAPDPAPVSSPPPTQNLSLLAGSIGGPATIDGTGANARFSDPLSITSDARGNLVVIDAAWLLRAITPSGTVSTLDRTGNHPVALAGDGAMWISDPISVHRISGSNDQAVASPAPSNLLEAGAFIVADNDGNAYVAGYGRCVVWKITPSLAVSRLAGSDSDCSSVDGPPGQGRIAFSISGLATDRHGAVYILESSEANTIRKITQDGTITTIAGSVGAEPVDGPGSSAVFAYPRGIAADGMGNVYVTDVAGIRKIDAAGNVTTLPIRGGQGLVDTFAMNGLDPSFNPDAPYPFGIAADEQGNLYLTNRINAVISVVRAGTTTPTLLAGLSADPREKDGVGSDARFSSTKFATMGTGGDIFVPSFSYDTGLVIRRVRADGTVTTQSYPQTAQVDALNGRIWLGYAFDPVHSVHYLTFDRPCTGNHAPDCVEQSAIWRVAADGSISQFTADGAWRFPVFDAQGNVFAVNALNLQKITPDGLVSSFATLGTGASALGIDATGNIYALGADALLKISPQGQIATIAGSPYMSDYVDATGANARFMDPVIYGGAPQLAIDPAGNVYVASPDKDGGVGYAPPAIPGLVRKVSPDGTVTTFIGQMGQRGIVLGSLPGRIYIPTSLLWTPNGLVVGSGGALLKVTQ